MSYKLTSALVILATAVIVATGSKFTKERKFTVNNVILFVSVMRAEIDVCHF